VERINPFLVKGYLGEKYFCDRLAENDKILSAIKNGRNLNLYNIRRIGKTALIHHSLNQLPDSFVPIFIDIEKTENQESLIRLLVDRLVKKIDELDKNLIRRMMQWASGVGISITLDEFTGSPKAVFSASEKIRERSLSEAFELTGLISKKKFVIAIDEFQQITNYPESNTEAIFRSVTQTHPEITFLFSGSSRHLMERIFTHSNAPFYQSTENIPLGYITSEEYLNFAKKFLHKCADEIILDLMSWCRYHTYYVQYTLNVLYDAMISGERINTHEIKERILKSHEFYYFSIRKLVTNEQWKILKEVAANSPVAKPLSAAFSAKTGIAQSTLKYNIQRLEEKDLLLREDDGLKIYNVFFSHLLSITKTDT